MAKKAYWVTTYRSISNPEALAAYAKLAPTAIAPFGGRYLARGTAAKAYEAGLKERIVISEFPSVDQAIAAYDSAGYTPPSRFASSNDNPPAISYSPSSFKRCRGGVNAPPTVQEYIPS